MKACRTISRGQDVSEKGKKKAFAYCSILELSIGNGNIGSAFIVNFDDVELACDTIPVKDTFYACPSAPLNTSSAWLCEARAKVRDSNDIDVRTIDLRIAASCVVVRGCELISAITAATLLSRN